MATVSERWCLAQVPALRPRLDLAALGNVAADPGDVLVVDIADVVRAEGADLATAKATAASAAAARAAVPIAATATTAPAGSSAAAAEPAAAAAEPAAAAAEAGTRRITLRSGAEARPRGVAVRAAWPLSYS
jgi:hypothetical protein